MPWIRYLSGHADSIRCLARTTNAWQIGLALTFLASIARNYDQTWIGEAPLKWIAGNILFSLVSGTFLFFCFHQFRPRDEVQPRPRLGSAWLQFMGLFWATAPIAWLYAIPVERFADSLTAARFNIALLGIVALWRVVLIARVASVLHSVRFVATFAGVLAASCVEIFVTFVSGGEFSRHILAGMGGLLNSPEERVVLVALNRTVSAAAIGFLPAVVIGLGARNWRVPKVGAEIVPAAAVLPWKWIGILAGVWIAIAIPAQRQVRLNADLDALVVSKRWRDALDQMAAHARGEYAPARQLPPKPYTYEAYEVVPPLLAAVTTNDPPWIQEHLLNRWNNLWIATGSAPSTNGLHQRVDIERDSELGTMFARMETSAWTPSIDGLGRFDSGRRWISNNIALLDAMRMLLAMSEPKGTTNAPSDTAVFRQLEERLARYPRP